MSASAKTRIVENHSLDEDWIIVSYRNGKKKKKLPEITSQGRELWTPADSIIDISRESKLMKKMLFSIKKVEASLFYSTFITQMESSVFGDSLKRAIGAEEKLQMVIYGIGSIEAFSDPRLQLSLAILMKRKFSWIESIELFDPILCVTECRVLETLDVSVLTKNELGRRCALKPTMFFMPHCGAELYDNLLQANWKVELLNHIILFGNSFDAYERHFLEFKSSNLIEAARYILATRKFKEEVGVETVLDDYFGAFHDSSWHFFNPVFETELEFISD